MSFPVIALLLTHFAPAAVGVGWYFTSVTTDMHMPVSPLGHMFSSHVYKGRIQGLFFSHNYLHCLRVLIETHKLIVNNEATICARGR